MAQQFLAPGTLLQGGNYKVVRYLSSGGFGNTYEAFDVNLNKRVAIKEFFVKDFCERDSQTMLVTPTTSKQPLINHLKNKFVEEARAIAGMEHENIIRVKTLFEENNTAYYVMDYIDGESLSDMINRRGPLPEKEAIPIILKVCDALAYMHKQGRFHLDVKPGNIMIRKDGKVILIDFGSSKQYAEVDGENTSTLSPCYTPGYAPTEQMNTKPSSFTAAADVYAVGATFYKMLTGVTPPVAIELLNEEATLSYPDTVSRSAIEAIEKTMIPQRTKRLQSIDEFTKILNSVPSKEGKVTVVPPISKGGDKLRKTKGNTDNVSTWDFLANGKVKRIRFFSLLLIILTIVGVVFFLQVIDRPSYPDPVVAAPAPEIPYGYNYLVTDPGCTNVRSGASSSTPVYSSVYKGDYFRGYPSSESASWIYIEDGPGAGGYIYYTKVKRIR